MISSKTFIKGALFASAAAISAILPMQSAKATNGMMPSCIGTDRCGMGGAGVAMPSMATDTAVNPAASAFLGNEYAVNIGWFWADVKGRANGGGYGSGDSGDQKSTADNFPNGSMAINYRVDDKIAFNLSVSPGAGGAVDWETSRTPNMNSGRADSEMDYMAVHITPSVSYKPSNNAAYGAGFIISRGSIRTNSVYGNFVGMGAGSGKEETFMGYGVHLGGIWKLDDKTNMAISYRSKIFHEDTGVYNDKVFSSPIDTPQQIQAGIAHQWDDQLSFALDLKVIDYEQVKTIGRAPNNGFGWSQQSVFMIGAEYAIDDALTVRAGYNYGESPITEDLAFQNFLYPAIVEHHITVGASYDLGNGMTLGASAYYAPENGLRDTTSAEAGTYITHEQKGFQVSIKSGF